MEDPINMRNIKQTLVILTIALVFTICIAGFAEAGSASVTVKGPSLFSYTVQLIRNGQVIAQNTNFTIPAGVRTMTWTNVPNGCDYYANVWVNGIGAQSHTWPSKCVSGSTLLGCLAFNIAGDPTPWTGTCKIY